MSAVNAAAVILFALSAWYLLRSQKEHFVILGYLCFLYLWTLVSCFYNDLGIANLELFRFTTPSYATARLALFSIVFLGGFWAAARVIGKRPLAQVDYHLSQSPVHLGWFKLFAYAGVGVLALYLLYSLAGEGMPDFHSIDRRAYFEQAGWLRRNLVIYGPLAAFLLGYFRRKRGRFSVNGSILALFIVYAALTGNKFSFIILLLVPYFLPIYVRYLAAHPNLRLFSLRQALTFMAILAVMVMFAFVRYWKVTGDPAFAYNYAQNRILAFQGQMWWAVDNDVAANGRYDGDHWQVELANITAPTSVTDAETGMKYLMVKVLGADKAYPIFEGGYLYTNAYPAILIVTFPYAIALLLQFLAGIVFFLILYYLYYSIRYRHTLRAAVAFLVLLPYIAMLLSGNFETFFTPAMAVKILTLTLLELGIGRAARITQSSPS
jgi:hypothetical protein